MTTMNKDKDDITYTYSIPQARTDCKENTCCTPSHSEHRTPVP